MSKCCCNADEKDVRESLSLKESQSLCGEWQEILSLRDWDVEVDVCRRQEFKEDQGQWAEIVYCLSHKHAVIRLIDPIDFESTFGDELDYEVLIVHELLHLHFAHWNHEPGTVDGLFEEQAINAIVKGLIKLKRSAGRNDSSEDNDLNSE